MPDALSRPVGAVTDLTENDLQANTDTRYLGLTLRKIKEAQRTDKVWTKIIRYLEGKGVPPKVPRNKPFNHFEIRDELLYLRREEFNKIRFNLVVPKELIAIACSISHDDSHLGSIKVLPRLESISTGLPF